MDRTLRYAIPAILTVGVAVTVLLICFVAWNQDHVSARDRLSYYQLYEDAFKAIVIGFGVALFGALLPAVLADARNRFDRMKESRLAYSNAKTGVDYLPLRLCSLPLTDAAAHIQSVHIQKHLSELYDELKQWLMRRKQAGMSNPEEWDDYLYDKLSTARVILEKHAHTWDQLTPDVRLGLLLNGGQSHKET